MPKPLQQNEILNYRKVSSFYAAVVILIIAAIVIYIFNATYSDISILVLLYVALLSSQGVIDEKVSVSNHHLIIKRRILFFSTTIKKSWQEMTHVFQEQHAKQSSLKLRFSDDLIELSEPDDEGMLYDFANLSAVIKSQASKYDIPIEIRKSDNKQSKFKQVVHVVVGIAFVLLVWFLLSQFDLFKPHAIHQHTLMFWLVIVLLSPYLYSYIYLKHINKKMMYQAEDTLLKKAYYSSYILLCIFGVNYFITQYVVVPKAKVLELTEENMFHQEWRDKTSNLTFFIRDDDMSYIKNAQVGSQQKFLVSDGWLGDHALIAISE